MLVECFCLGWENARQDPDSESAQEGTHKERRFRPAKKVFVSREVFGRNVVRRVKAAGGSRKKTGETGGEF